ncbi:MAG: hypothetical protein AB7U73_08245 [Pirellulales bacterium]
MARNANDQETRDRVSARHAATALLSLADGELLTHPGETFRHHLFTILRDRAVDEVGLPRRLAREVEPLSDRAAEAFEHCVMQFGKYHGHTVGDVHKTDPRYLANLADGTPFTQRLKQYLAREKYDDGD